MTEQKPTVEIREVPGASHALGVSHPDAVTTSILEATSAVGG